MQFRPLALIAWMLAYISVYTAWAVVARPCTDMPAARWWLLAVLLIVGFVIAAGAATTDPPDGSERPVRDGLVTWVVSLTGLLAMAPLFVALWFPPIGLVLIIALWRVEKRGVGGVWAGLLWTAAAFLIVMAGVPVLEPVAEALFQSSLRPGDETSVQLLAAALPMTLGMALIHTTPKWTPGGASAVIRGALIGSAMCTTVIAFALFSCGK